VALTIVTAGKQRSLELSLEHGHWLQRRDGQRKTVSDSRGGHWKGVITDGRATRGWNQKHTNKETFSVLHF